MAKALSTKPTGQPVPGRGLLVLALLVSLAGLACAADLALLHWQVHNLPGHVSFCAVSERVNCDTVAMSRFSRLAGLPIAWWGTMFYGLLAVVAGWGIFARRPGWPWSWLGVLFAFAVGLSVWLLLISELVIGSYCLLCLTLYLLNTAGAAVAWGGTRRSRGPAAGLAVVLGLALLVSSGLFAVQFSETLAEGWPIAASTAGFGAVLLALAVWRRGLSGLPRLVSGLVAETAVVFERRAWGCVLAGLALAVLVGGYCVQPLLYPEGGTEIAGGTEGLAHGWTAEGHAWIGAERPEVTIVEYSDYECPFCRRAHEMVREVVRLHGDWLRLVHVHMPLDQACNPQLSKPFHRNSCACALATICAGEQGAFWPVNDRLFVRRGGLDAIGLSMLAERMGLDGVRLLTCMRSETARAKLRADLELARRRGLKPATPAFDIGGQIVVGLKDRDWWIRTASALRASAHGAKAEGAEHGSTPRTGGR